MDAAVFSSANSYDKCCKTGEYVQEANNVYGCTKNASKRLGVLTKRTDFLGKGVDGECADLTPEFSIFKVSRGKIVERRLVEMSYFPKCCPLNYTYNTALHSCEERGHAAPDYIKETFVKVGLPDCKVIVDVQLNKTIDLYRGIINENGYTEYCLDENEKGSFTMRQCRKDTKVCDGIRCVKKCCPDGQSFVGGRRCLDTYTHGLNLTFSSKVQDPEGTSKL